MHTFFTFSIFLYIFELFEAFLIVSFFPLSLFSFALVVSMSPKCKSTLSQNPLRSGASSSSDPTPYIRFRDEDARKDFSENFSLRGVHLECRVIWWTSPTLTYPMSFTVRVESHCVTSRSLVLPCWSKSFTPTWMDSIIPYISFTLTFKVRALLSHRSLLQMCSVFRGKSILTTPDVIVWGLCPKTRWSLLSTSALLIEVTIRLHHVRPLLKVLDS